MNESRSGRLVELIRLASAREPRSTPGRMQAQPSPLPALNRASEKPVDCSSRLLVIMAVRQTLSTKPLSGSSRAFASGSWHVYEN